MFKLKVKFKLGNFLEYLSKKKLLQFNCTIPDKNLFRNRNDNYSNGQDEYIDEKAESISIDDKAISAAAAEQTSHQSGQVQQAQKQTRRIGVSRQVEVAAPLESKTQETENQKFVQHEQKLKALEQQVELQQYT